MTAVKREHLGLPSAHAVDVHVTLRRKMYRTTLVHQIPPLNTAMHPIIRNISDPYTSIISIHPKPALVAK